jgi:flagellar basal-body rod protein FlgG
MLRQLRVGATGMDAFEKEMVNITNQVANAKTVGFKKSRVMMENLFPQVLEKVVAEVDNEGTQEAVIELGSGVRVVATPKDFTQGNTQTTSNPLDLCINGAGLFMIQKPDGSTAYTRAGNFHRDDQGNVVDPNGHFLVPNIIIPQEVSNIRIAPDGSIFVRVGGENQPESLAGQISIARFARPEALVSIGQNLFEATAAAGEVTEGIPAHEGFGKIAQYTLEGSNVDIVASMMDMIIVQRSFDIISKAIQIGESMAKSAIEVARAT